MAIVFELVIQYDEDGAALRKARDLFAAWPPIVAGQHRVPLHAPRVRATGLGRYELSIVPVSVSQGNGMDGTLPRLALTEPELSELGAGLYRILAKLDGYRCAAVGWDPEHLFDEDPGDAAESEWREQIEAGYLQGLVLSESLKQELSIDTPNLNSSRPDSPGSPTREPKYDGMASAAASPQMTAPIPSGRAQSCPIKQKNPARRPDLFQCRSTCHHRLIPYSP